MQFDNPCLGGLEYEPTPFAVTMAGAFLSFLVDYSGIRILAHQTAQRQRAREEMSGANQTQQDAISPISSDGKDAFEQYDAARANDLKRNQAEEQKLGVFIMEGGIIFHSISKHDMF
jgi:zinc transporter 1/2/3